MLDPPVFFKSYQIVLVKGVPPAVDIDHTCSSGDQQHEGEFDHVADLHQHGGGDESQYCDVAVVFRILRTAAGGQSDWSDRSHLIGGGLWWTTAQLQKTSEVQLSKTSS